jgi:hypothetical protein
MQLAFEFTEFLALKMYSLTYDALERKKVEESFLGELN